MTGPTFQVSVCLLVLTAGALDARAQTSNEDACKTVLAAQFPETTGVTSQFCSALGFGVMTRLTAPAVDIQLQTAEQRKAQEARKERVVRVADIFGQRDLQGRGSQQAALEGTPAQGHAIPSVQPAGVAAGTIAALGTDAGQGAIAALSVNPATLFLAQQVSEQLAKFSRLADITVFVPITSATTTAATTTTGTTGSAAANRPGTLRYFGARLRLNVTGISSGSTVWNKADELRTAWIKTLVVKATELGAILAKAPNVSGCVTDLLGPHAAVATVCGAPFEFAPDLNQASQLREELTKVRREADSRYFGADIRVDSGDPTLGAVANSSGQFLFAGVSMGRRLNTAEGGTAGIRGRVGIRNAKLDTQATAEFGVEGGIGFELARYLGEDELDVSGAIDFRYSKAPEALRERLQSNFSMLRGSLSIPIGGANSVSINLGLPISGAVSPTLSVNFNWGLLLPTKPEVR